MKSSFLITLFLLSGCIVSAQKANSIIRTSSCIFNDTLWIVNANGFQYVAINANELIRPDSVIHPELSNSISLFKSESFLWLHRGQELLRYDGKNIRRTSFPFDHVIQMGIKEISTDDSLFIDLYYEKPELKSENGNPVVIKKVVWTNGAFSEIKEKKEIRTLKTSKGDVYTFTPYEIYLHKTFGESHKIDINQPLRRVEFHWIAPDDKIWIYQEKVGFSIIDKTEVKVIPFYFKEIWIWDYRLFFLENGNVVAISGKQYAVYDYERWYLFDMPERTFFSQREVHHYKNIIYIIDGDKIRTKDIL